MARQKNRGLTVRVLDAKVRRNSHKNVRYLNVLDDNCSINTEAFIERAKNSVTFGTVCWNETTWDVSATYTSRGHKQRATYFNFTQHQKQNDKAGRIGAAFDNTNRFADLVKSTIRLRAEIGGQVANNQVEIIIAFRYLYDQLQNVSYDIRLLTPSHLDAATKEVLKRETEISAYKRLEKIEEISRLLDKNGLVRARMNWKCSRKQRPSSLQGLRVDDIDAAEIKTDKLPRHGVLEAVAHLYHCIPADVWADRVRICLAALLMIAGFRIGELLTLPAMPVQTEDGTGRKFLIYYPEKGAPPQKKWLSTIGGEIADVIVKELLNLTAAPRAAAMWLYNNPAQINIEGLDLSNPTVRIRDLADALGLKPSARHFLNTRKISAEGERGKATVFTGELVEKLRAESYEAPVNVVNGSGEKLLLKDSLACAFLNAFHSDKATFKYAVLPVSEQQVSDFLSSRAGIPAAFERYGVIGPDGKTLKVASHAFRHWLNDNFDKGGLSDLEQAVYFGRVNPKDNRAYQHMSMRERVLKAREDLKNGNMLGPIATVISRLPIDKKDLILRARVQAVHVVPGGACFHEFSQSPCPKHMACTDGCGDFHWQTDDAIQTKELEFQKDVLKVALSTAQKEVSEESWNADAWLSHNARKLEQVEKSLADFKPIEGN